MFYSTVSICFSTTATHLFAPRPLFDSVATCVFFKTLFINIPRGAILKPSTPTSSNEWNSLFLSFFFLCFEIVNFPDLSWIWILPPFRIKNASKSKNLYSKIRIPRFYSQIKLFDLTATKPHTNTHTHVYTKIQRKSKFNESNETRRNRKANWNSITKINCKKKRYLSKKPKFGRFGNFIGQAVTISVIGHLRGAKSDRSIEFSWERCVQGFSCREGGEDVNSTADYLKL